MDRSIDDKLAATLPSGEFRDDLMAANVGNGNRALFLDLGERDVADTFDLANRRQVADRVEGLAPGAPRPDFAGRKESRMPEIEIYTQPWCPFCARAVSLLSGKGVAFREIDAPHGTPEREESIRRSGGRSTVPQIFIDGRHIGGSDELVALDRAGKLDPLLRAG